MLGLTDISTPALAVFSDETINARLDRYGPQEGMTKLCEELANFYDLQPVRISQQLGATIEFVRDRAKGLRDLAKRFRSGEESFGEPVTVANASAAAIDTPSVEACDLRIGK